MKRKTEQSPEGNQSRLVERIQKRHRIASVMGDLTKQLAIVLLTGAFLSSVPARATQAAEAKAAAIHQGDTVQVKSSSIWFKTSEELAIWQRFPEKFGPKDVETYKNLILEMRAAWQFDATLPVRVISYAPELHAVEVKMLTKGRLFNTVWWVDEKDCSKAK
jgi:hypothetical protein